MKRWLLSVKPFVLNVKVWILSFLWSYVHCTVCLLCFSFLWSYVQYVSYACHFCGAMYSMSPMLILMLCDTVSTDILLVDLLEEKMNATCFDIPVNNKYVMI